MGVGIPVRMTASLSETAAADDTRDGRLTSPPGTVAGTVLRAARLSALLSQIQLAEAVGASETDVAEWEDGTSPLAEISYPVLRRIESALASVAEPGIMADLPAAIWCDLAIAAMVSAEDASCLLSDPTATESAFGELLAWSVSGRRPARYRPYAGPGPLLWPADADRIAGAVQRLGRIWHLLDGLAA
jgi:transcriptional regulator with XRE-family HTH domain